MGRLLAASLLVAIGAGSAAQATDVGGKTRLSTGLDVGWLDASGYESWTDGSVGKLRDDASGLTIRRGYLEVATRLTATVDLHAAFEAYDDDLGRGIDLIESYVRWRPVPVSATRYRLRFGAFYPRVSLENVAPGWGSPYSLDFSAINTWIAEEFRSLGAEISIIRRPERLGGNHEFAMHISAFYGSDPAGSLLAWKGWSIHNRQTGYGDELPLPALPQIQPGGMFQAQDPYATPLREVDDKAGYAVTADWDFRRRLKLRAGFYDNNADPELLVSGQYGWRTRFMHFGLQATLPGDVGLVGQFMTGSTMMGPKLGDARAVDAGYDAWFLLLTRQFERHRLSLRYDNFEVDDDDQTPDDRNSESGLAWMASYGYELSRNVDLVAEWLSIKTHHDAWAYFGFDPTRTEKQWQLLARLHF